MKKTLSTCLLFLQIFGMTKTYADTYEQIEPISKKLKICSSKEDPLKYLTNKNKRQSDYKVWWRDIEIPAARPGLLRLLTRMFSRETDNESVQANMDVIKVFPGIDKCKHEVCIIKNIFGEEEGIYYFYLLDKYNFNISPYASYFDVRGDMYEDSHLFTLEELKNIADVFNMLPVELFKHFKFGSHFKKIDRDKAPDKENVIADSAMRFYSLFSRLDKEEQAATIIHEIGHNMADSLGLKSLDETAAWYEISGWKRNEAKDADGKIEVSYTYNLQSNNFVSEYAKSSPVEDFAEAFAAYVVNPNFLKQKSIKKYNYMKNVIFGGIEYTGNSCKTQGSKEINIKLEESGNNVSSCLNEFVLGIKSVSEVEFNRCLIKNYAQTESVVLTLGDDDAKMLLGNEFVSKKQSEVVNLFVNNVFVNPSYCLSNDSYPFLAFDYNKSGIDEYEAKMYLYNHAKDLCRWSKNASQNEHELRGNLSRILKNRVFGK